MKYLIKESQIKKFIWNYFDSEDYDIDEDKVEIFLIDENGNTDWNYVFEGGTLFVDNNIITAVEGMFGVSFDDALEYAGEWFEDKYDFPVEEIINWNL